MTTRSTPPRAPSIPEKEAPSIVSDPHLYECFKKLIEWMQQASAFMAQVVPGGAVVSAGDTWAESTTTGDGVTTTFLFTIPVVTLKGVWIGGAAQRPSQCTVSGGAVVFDPLIPPPTAEEKVTALYR